MIKYDKVIYHVFAWKHYIDRFVMFCFNSSWLAETSPMPRPWGAKLRTIDWTNQLLALKHQGWWSFFGSWFSLSTILKDFIDLVDTLIIIEHQTPHTLSANRKVHHKVSLYDSHLICKTQVFDSPIHLNHFKPPYQTHQHLRWFQNSDRGTALAEEWGLW